MIEKYFKDFSNRFELDWDYIATIPEFAKLKECEQNPKWHGEGSVWDHTFECVSRAYKLIQEAFIDDLLTRQIWILSVLFHDIGKGVTTEFTKDNWHAYGHEFAGEKIARRMLWDEPIYFREMICNAARFHMDVLRLTDSRECLKKIVDMSLNYAFEWKHILFVKKCDILGSRPEDENQTNIDLEKIKFITELCYALAVYERPFGANLNISYKNMMLDLMDGKKPDITGNKQTVYMLIGLPGAGKNTYIENYMGESALSISRDDIRAELGYCKDGEKVVLSAEKEEEVTKVFNECLIKYALSGKDFVINNINLKKKYRDDYRRLLAKFPIRWQYVYIEAPTIEHNISRRQTFDPCVLVNMTETFEWPHDGETKSLIVKKERL